MKLMFYTCGLRKGGAERILTTLADFFSEKNEVIIVTNVLDSIEYSFSKRVRVISLDKKRIKNSFQKIRYKCSGKRTQELEKWIEEEKPNIVISFLSEPSIRLLKVKRNIKNLKTIVCVRSYPKYEFPFCKWIRNYYYRYANKIIVQSEYYKKYFPNKLQEKIISIPNFLTDSFLVPNSSIKRKKIVTVARLEKEKNVSLLIEAYRSLKQKEYSLYIYGEGSLRKNLEKKIKKYHLENKVFLKGNVDNIREEIKDASIFVSTSNYEGFPNAILEAIALAIPVIATNSTEVIKELIHEENGRIIPKKNRKALTKAFEELIKVKKEAEKLEEHSNVIKEKYAKEKIIEKWESLFETKTVKNFKKDEKNEVGCRSKRR